MLIVLETYLTELKQVIKIRQKGQPSIAKTMFESHNEGYLQALNAVMKDVSRMIIDINSNIVRGIENSASTVCPSSYDISKEDNPSRRD